MGNSTTIIVVGVAAVVGVWFFTRTKVVAVQSGSTTTAGTTVSQPSASNQLLNAGVSAGIGLGGSALGSLFQSLSGSNDGSDDSDDGS